MSGFGGLGFPLPPLLFLSCLVAGGLLQMLRPLAIAPMPLAVCVAGAMAAWAPAVLIVTSALRSMNRARTPHHPRATPSALVTGGPFRFSRNPLYLSLLLMLGGFALLLNSLWLLLAVPLLFGLLSVLAIRREEAMLARTFGAEYDAYRARVRRWI